MTNLFLAMSFTTFLAAGLIVLLEKPVRRVGLVDRPGGRKCHAGEIPLSGGVAIVLAFGTSLVFVPSGEAVLPLLVAMIFMAYIGVIDDMAHLSATFRLVGQVVISLYSVLVGGLVISHLGWVPGVGRVELGLFAIPFTIICLTGLINAINMADGLDGLAGGMVSVMLGWLAILSWLMGLPELAWGPLMLLAGVMGFLLWNFPWFRATRARVFLGDAGSLALGVALGWMTVEIAMTQQVLVPPIAFAWILAVPVFETVVVMIRRMLHGQSPLDADREHLHHHLVRVGFQRRTVSFFMVGVSFVTGAVGVLGWLMGVPDWLSLVAFVSLGVGHLVWLEFVLSRRPSAEGRVVGG